jgi:hypothetical protein
MREALKYERFSQKLRTQKVQKPNALLKGRKIHFSEADDGLRRASDNKRMRLDLDQSSINRVQKVFPTRTSLDKYKAVFICSSQSNSWTPSRLRNIRALSSSLHHTSHPELWFVPLVCQSGGAAGRFPGNPLGRDGRLPCAAMDSWEWSGK